MGRYIQWNDVVNRYPSFETIDDATGMSDEHIAYAESYVDGSLAGHYTVPFSAGNILVKDLCADIVFARLNKTDAEEADRIMQLAMDRLGDLKEGTLTMVDSSGTVIAQTPRATEMWTSTQAYTPIFGHSDIEEAEYSEGRLSDEDASRGN